MRISDWSSDVCSSDLAKALAMALPGSLENAAAAVGMENGKDVKGRATMLQLSRPRRIDPDGTIVWWDTPDRLERLYAYNIQDVEVEPERDKQLHHLSPYPTHIFQPNRGSPPSP